MRIEFRDIIFAMFALLVTLILLFYPTHHDASRAKIDLSPPPATVMSNLP